MSFADTVARFHVGLDGVGLLLQGAPNSPAYRVTNSPVYGTRFASGDRDYNDLSQWWYLIQTDWSGGIKETVSFEDDAKFYYSSNIDARTRPGSLRLEKQLVLEYDNDANNDEIMAMFAPVQNGNDIPLFVDNNTVRTLGGTAMFDNNETPNNVIGRGAHLWCFGNIVANTTATSNPRTLSVKTTTVNGLIEGSINECFGLVSGNSLYVVGISTVEKLFIVRTNVQDPTVAGNWTLLAEVPFGNDLGVHFAGAAIVGGEIVTLVSAEPAWHLHAFDIATNTITKLTEFTGGTQIGSYYKGGRYVQTFQNKVIITVCTAGTSDEEGEIWEYDGSTLTKIYSTGEIKPSFSTREAKSWLTGGATIMGDYAFWGNLVYDGTSFFNFIKDVTDNSGRVGIPVGTDGQYLYCVDNLVTGSDRQSQIYRYEPRGTVFKDGANDEAFLIFSLQDNLQSIDKLLHTLTIGFDKLLSGQAIRLLYTLNPVPDPNITTGEWQVLGDISFSVDGGSVTSKVFQFPDGVTAKKIWFRIQLSSGGTNTPSVNDFALEYLPMPDYRFQWNLNINCADEVKDLSGALVETTARELKARLMRAWMTKSALDYQDLDFASTQLNGALDATTGTVTVDSTAYFPEQGRIKIGEEEVFYTGKTPSAFTGCTRGARGTRAVTQLDNAAVHNGYRVLVMDIDVRVPILGEGKNLEYITGLTLREV